ncbi:MAG: hypothetical protein HGA96_09395 [Desulfobulbaceae bacterium]|nr:hypothetical protein [Desulfobulbaceae bacterium]
MTVKCCVCTKTRINDQWLDAEIKANELVSHSYCPACLDAALAELTAHNQTNGNATPQPHHASAF